MIAYHYDDKGYYTGEQNCQKDPLESLKAGKDIFLLPGNCTYEIPPEDKEGFKRKFTDGKWEYEEVIEEKEPENYEPSEKEKLEMKMWELKGELAKSDYKAIKYAEGLITSKEYAPIKKERQKLRDQINELDEQLEAYAL